MVKIFADGANIEDILKYNQDDRISGITTNPSLLRKAGVTDYRKFAKEVLTHVKDKSVSFEVISDDFSEMYDQALDIASWGENVYVKIPITNTKGESSYNLINLLACNNVKVNITAITTFKQVSTIIDALDFITPSYISIFAGRVADTGVDPLQLMRRSVNLVHKHAPSIEVIWASPREVYNVYQASDIECDIITCTPDILNKLSLNGKDLTDYSRETVQMFYDDAVKSGLKL